MRGGARHGMGRPTGKAALDFIRGEADALASVATALRVPPALAADRVAALLDEVKALKKQSSQRRPDAPARRSPEELLAAATPVGDIRVVAESLDASTPDELRQSIDVLRRKVGTSLAVLLCSAVDGKVHLAAGLTADLVARGLHSGNWLKAVAPVVGGGGGGRPDLAQAGGKDPAKIPDALRAAIEFIQAATS